MIKMCPPQKSSVVKLLKLFGPWQTGEEGKQCSWWGPPCRPSQGEEVEPEGRPKPKALAEVQAASPPSQIHGGSAVSFNRINSPEAGIVALLRFVLADLEGCGHIPRPGVCRLCRPLNPAGEVAYPGNEPARRFTLRTSQRGLPISPAGGVWAAFRVNWGMQSSRSQRLSGLPPNPATAGFLEFKGGDHPSC